MTLIEHLRRLNRPKAGLRSSMRRIRILVHLNLLQFLFKKHLLVIFDEHGPSLSASPLTSSKGLYCADFCQAFVHATFACQAFNSCCFFFGCCLVHLVQDEYNSALTYCVEKKPNKHDVVKVIFKLANTDILQDGCSYERTVRNTQNGQRAHVNNILKLFSNFLVD